MNNKFIKKIFLSSSLLLSFGVISSTLYSCNSNANTYNVTFKSECLDLLGETTAKSNEDYICSFKIKDDIIPSRYMDNIDLDKFKVTVSGKEIDVEGFSFIYQTNAKNQFTINNKYITGDIEITADLSKRTQKQNSFFFEFDLEAADFKDIEVLYPVSGKQGDKTAIDDDKTKTKDNIIMKDEYDIAIIPKDKPHELFGDGYDLLVLREDNTFKIKINAKEGMTLPKNIWFRSNARYTKKDEDFTITYSSDYKSAILEVPYFFIRDNGSIRVNPDVEA